MSSTRRTEGEEKEFVFRAHCLPYHNAPFREFLTGFRKRKLERKARAQKEIEDKLLKERKAIKADVKNNFFSQFKKSFEPIADLEPEEDKEEEYEDDEVKVKIVELSTADLARENNWIGANRGKVQETSSEEESEAEDEPEEAVPGMSVTAPKAPKKVKSAEETKTDKEAKDIKTKKDLTRAVRDQTSKLMKQTKAFKMKKNLDMMKSRKKARGEKRKKIHVLKNQSKKRGGKHKDLLKKQKSDRNSRKEKKGKGK